MQQGTLHPGPKQHLWGCWGRWQKLIQSGGDWYCFSLIKWKNIYMTLNFTVLHIWQHLKPIFVVILDSIIAMFFIHASKQCLMTKLENNWNPSLAIHCEVYIFSSQHCSFWKISLFGVKSKLSCKMECTEQTLPAFYKHSPRSPRCSVFFYSVPSASRECRGKMDKSLWENILIDSHG